MRKSTKEKTLQIFRIANVLLFTVYAAAIAVSVFRKSSSEKDGSIFSEKDKDKIKFIQIQDGNSSTVNFEKMGMIWTVSDADEQNPTLAIADSNMVSALIDNACRKSTMIKKADKKSSLVPFELSEGQATRITFRDSKGSVTADFFLGKVNSHTHNTTFRHADETAVWEKEFTAATSTDINDWAEHLIYPEFISGKSTGLTRGKISKLRPAENAKPEAVIKKEFQSSSKVILKIYGADENYLVVPQFIADSSFNAESKEALNFLKFNYTISAYTFERLLAEGKNE